MISELLSPRGNYNRYSPKNVSPSYAKSIICYINGKPSNYGNSGISIDLHSTSTSIPLIASRRETVANTSQKSF